MGIGGICKLKGVTFYQFSSSSRMKSSAGIELFTTHKISSGGKALVYFKNEVMWV